MIPKQRRDAINRLVRKGKVVFTNNDEENLYAFGRYHHVRQYPLEIASRMVRMVNPENADMCGKDDELIRAVALDCKEHFLIRDALEDALKNERWTKAGKERVSVLIARLIAIWKNV